MTTTAFTLSGVPSAVPFCLPDMQCIHSGTHSAALAALHSRTEGLAWPAEWETAGVDRDSVLQRYFQAGNRDIETAAQMLAATIKWRDELGVSRALSANLPDEVPHLSCAGATTRRCCPPSDPPPRVDSLLAIAPSNRSSCS